MKPTTIWIIILIIIILVVISFTFWIYFLPSPSVKLCNNMKKNKPNTWNENCTFPLATGNLDSTIQSPSSIPLYMANFSYSNEGGLPMCQPMWYRFRYVNDYSGNYSDWSPWTSSPIMAGGTNFPCYESCSPAMEGINSCKFNRVVLGLIQNPQYTITDVEPNGSQNWSVLYRYIDKSGGTSPPQNVSDSEMEPIGMLIPSSSYVDFKYTTTDLGNNPCIDTNQPGCQKTCNGCS